MSSASSRKYALPALALLAASACASTPGGDDAASETAANAPASETDREIANRSDPLTRARFWAEEYTKDPSDLDTALEHIRSLRAIGSTDRAAEIAGQTLTLHPGSFDLAMELGRASAAEGRLDVAVAAFQRAAVLDPMKAAPYAALGLALDRAERHISAQDAYKAALDLEPDRASTRANYGLSLALSGDLPGAEIQLRQAADAPGASVQIRQNYALVLGLQGKFDEMKAVSGEDAPAELLERNADVLRSMISPTRSYGRLREEGDD